MEHKKSYNGNFKGSAVLLINKNKSGPTRIENLRSRQSYNGNFEASIPLLINKRKNNVKEYQRIEHLMEHKKSYNGNFKASTPLLIYSLTQTDSKSCSVLFT